MCQDALIGVCMVPLVKPYDKNGESAHDAARFAVEMFNEKHNPEVGLSFSFGLDCFYLFISFGSVTHYKL